VRKKLLLGARLYDRRPTPLPIARTGTPFSIGVKRKGSFKKAKDEG
jgi:hypothetical protein